MLEAAAPVGEGRIVSAEEDGDGRRWLAERSTVHCPIQHLQRPPRVVPAVPPQYDVRLTNDSGNRTDRTITPKENPSRDR